MVCLVEVREGVAGVDQGEGGLGVECLRDVHSCLLLLLLVLIEVEVCERVVDWGQ
jgi:hypothetical protein